MSLHDEYLLPERLSSDLEEILDELERALPAHRGCIEVSGIGGSPSF